MTDQMRDDQLDHHIRSFLAWRAEDIADAPTATEVAMGIKTRTGTRAGVPRISGQLAWLLIAGLLAVALIGAAVVGANLLRDDRALVVVDPTARVAPTAGASYEAVFLRTGPVQGGSADVLVVAVDSRGNEREILTLPASWQDPYGSGAFDEEITWFLRSAGAVTPTGLLAVPRTNGDYTFHWEIVDLNRPDAAPIVVAGIKQDFHRRGFFPYKDDVRPLPFWGPGEHVAIPSSAMSESGWTEHVSFIDGRTGEVATVARGGLIPYWTLDGSGVLVYVGVLRADGSLDEGRVLRVDGSLVDRIPAVTDDGHSRRYRSDGTLVDPIRHDDCRRDVDIRALLPDGRCTVSRAGFEIDEIAWTADGGGTWLLMRSLTDSHSVQIERTAASSASQAPLTLRDPSGRDVSGLGAEFAGIAPDDSMITVIFGERLGAERSSFYDFGERSPNWEATLVVPGTGAWFDIEGSFAGWLDVDP